MTQNWISSCYRTASLCTQASGQSLREFCSLREPPSLREPYLRMSLERSPNVFGNYKWFLQGPRGVISINCRAERRPTCELCFPISAPGQHIRRCWARLNNYWTFSSNKFHATNPACRLGIDNSIEVRVVRWTEPPLLLLQEAPFDLDTRTRARACTCTYYNQ